MVTLKGKDAERFVKKMIKKEKSPISKADKKLASEIKHNMDRLQVGDGLCTRCHKNKATIKYSDSVLSHAHGFISNICKECYDKQKKESEWYKEGRKDVIKEIKSKRKKYIDGDKYDSDEIDTIIINEIISNRLKNQRKGNEYNYDRIRAEDKNDIDVKEINKIL